MLQNNNKYVPVNSQGTLLLSSILHCRVVVPLHTELRNVNWLHGLIKRLKQDPAVLQEYDATIKDQLRRGIVERLDPLEECPDLIHYLLHQEVVRRGKETTKVRVVYDASAHSDGPSLNDCWHTGPKFDQRILNILLRFRVHCVGWQLWSAFVWW